MERRFCAGTRITLGSGRIQAYTSGRARCTRTLRSKVHASARAAKWQGGPGGGIFFAASVSFLLTVMSLVRTGAQFNFCGSDGSGTACCFCGGGTGGAKCENRELENARTCCCVACVWSSYSLLCTFGGVPSKPCSKKKRGYESTSVVRTSTPCPSPALPHPPPPFPSSSPPLPSRWTLTTNVERSDHTP